MTAEQKLTAEERVQLLETILRMNIFEENLLRLFDQGRISGFHHAGRGQEGVQAGAIAALRKDDYLLYAHRGVGYEIAKGVPPSKVYGDFLGTVEGTTRGKGAGIVHIAWPDTGVLGQSGTLGGSFPIAAGAGLSIKQRGTDQVVLCFFGDGTANRGTFHESVNFAALHKLPVIYLCENNGWAVSTCTDSSTAGQIYKRAVGYDMPGRFVDGMDPEATYYAVAEGVERARKGEGPTLIEAECFRFRGHYEGDPCTYRDPSVLEEGKRRDPLVVYPRRLKEEGLLTDEQLDQMKARIQKEMEEAIAKAESAPFPGRERIFEDLYV
jgi:TPP-dependent pyruvate/acetoin dehydrogenase alpha subunit